MIKASFAICKKFPEVYNDTFQDYLITPGNGMKQITLSSLNLAKVNKITVPLTALADALDLVQYPIRS